MSLIIGINLKDSPLNPPSEVVFQVGFDIKLTLPILVIALCFNGAGIGGQQVVGVVDAMHEAAAAGYPDNPATHGLIAGLWSSLSGAGRFVSRGASGFLVEQFGFDAVSTIACGMQAMLLLKHFQSSLNFPQVAIAGATFLYIIMFECSLVSRDSRLRSLSVTIVEQVENQFNPSAFFPKKTK